MSLIPCTNIAVLSNALIVVSHTVMVGSFRFTLRFHLWPAELEIVGGGLAITSL